VRYSLSMTEIAIGYARCSTDKQDLTVQREALLKFGVAAERIYIDHGLTGTNRLSELSTNGLCTGKARPSIARLP
jgi:hypothetical protein